MGDLLIMMKFIFGLLTFRDFFKNIYWNLVRLVIEKINDKHQRRKA